ncbi:MAG: CopG family transcriptional regulator [Bacilli bacterium]|nr:CopG family transcriptional regulator [Bacilli bacterium]MDY4155401.1 CopG family transcriptional regulator [Bacilli bacterium]
MNEKLRLTQKKYKGETSVVSLRLPVELVKRIDDVSNETGRTRNDVIIKCLDFALDNVVIEEGNNK